MGDIVNIMSDLIERQAAIDALRTCYDTETISMDNGDEYINYSDAVGGIEHLPSAQPEQRWIPVTEKLPEEGSYLVWMPFAPPKHRVTVAEYCDGYWNIKTPISAWMPLPEPRKGETDD